MALTKIRAEQISDIDFKQAVRVVATTNVTLTNGAVDTIDGVLLAVSNRVLVTAQSTASQNGLYRVSVLGNGANGTWVRSSDGDATGDMSAGMLVTVTEGTVYADTQWQLTTNNPIVLGTTSLVFAQTSSGGGSYTAGTGLTLTGSAFSVNAAQTQITSVGTLTALSVSGTVTGGNLTTSGAITGASVSVSGNVTGGNVNTGGLISSTGNITSTANVTGNYILGNGSQLTGIAGSYGNIEVAAFLPTYTGNLVALTGNIITTANVTGGNLIQGTTRVYKWTTGATAPTYPEAGDEWYNSSTDVLYKYINDSVGSQWVDQSFPTSFGNITIAGTANITGTISGSGNLSVTGNISGNYILGSGNISLAGNVTGGNLLTGGLISAAGNITGGNVLGGANVNATTHTGTTVSVTGNITSGASVNTTNLSVSGNVLGNLLPSSNVTFNLGSPTQRWNTLYLAANTIDLGSQTISATETGISMGTGNLTGGNITTTGIVTGALIQTTTTSLASNITIATSSMAIGPITIPTNVNATVNTGVRWVIF